VIPAAGLGTPVLSVTKEQPKEMLPVFAKAKNGDLCLKPIVRLVFEQLRLSRFVLGHFCRVWLLLKQLVCVARRRLF